MRVQSLASFAALAQFSAADIEIRQSNWTVGQTVQTGSGPVQGHAALNATGVSEYLGIPFANPPTGNLRFAAPEKYSGNSSINGTNFGFSCPSGSSSASASGIAAANITGAGIQVLASLAELGDKFSEDCLTLNVWTKPQNGETKKAVLVWIYGGGFTTGNTANPAYGGQYFADQEDVVLVSINYRVNIFGFPGSPNTTQNLGLLDQRLAIEWVRDNVASFGGDPSRITLFGQSAGGASVDYYTYAWTQDPIAAGFIPESGTANGFGQNTASYSEGLWHNVTAQVGCGSVNSSEAEVLSCMRTKDYASILAVVPTFQARGQGGASFGPTIDEKVIFSNYPSRSQAGNFIKKPMLLGNTNYEAGLFRAINAITNITLPDTFWDAFNENAFNCPAAVRANISVANGVKTWRYRWFGVFPNTIITSVPDAGAWHASELPVLFGNVPFGAGIPASTAEEESIGRYIRGAWAAFAKNPQSGLASYEGGWPTYNPGGNTLLRLGYQNVTGTNLAAGMMYDGACKQVFAVNGSQAANGTSTGTAPIATVTASGSGKRSTSAMLVVLMAIAFASVL